MKNAVTGLGKGHRNRKLGSQKRSTTVATNKEKIHMVVIRPGFQNEPSHSYLATNSRLPSPLLCDQYRGPLHVNDLLCMHTHTHAHTHTHTQPTDVCALILSLA